MIIFFSSRYILGKKESVSCSKSSYLNSSVILFDISINFFLPFNFLFLPDFFEEVNFLEENLFSFIGTKFISDILGRKGNQK